MFFLIVVYVHYHFGQFLCGIWCNKLSEIKVIFGIFLFKASKIAVIVVAEV